MEFDIDLGFHLHMRTKMRLEKINAPEMNTDEGKAAKDFLAAFLRESPHGILTSHSLDKYGRVLGDFRPDTARQSISQVMIHAGHASPYIER